MKMPIYIVLCVSLVFSVETPFSAAASPRSNQAKSIPREQKVSPRQTPDTKTAERTLPSTTDVALSGKQGTLLGQVIGPAGKPRPNVMVSLRVDNRVSAKGKSDSQGRFAFTNLRGGVYQVMAGNGFGTFRAWADGTAPKSAKRKALVVVAEETIRGQMGKPDWKGRLRRCLRNPIVLAGIVGTAVAVPLAVQDSKDDPSGAPTPVPEAIEGGTEGPASE